MSRTGCTLARTLDSTLDMTGRWTLDNGGRWRDRWALEIRQHVEEDAGRCTGRTEYRLRPLSPYNSMPLIDTFRVLNQLLYVLP